MAIEKGLELSWCEASQLEVVGNKKMHTSPRQANPHKVAALPHPEECGFAHNSFVLFLDQSLLWSYHSPRWYALVARALSGSIRQKMTECSLTASKAPCFAPRTIPF